MTVSLMEERPTHFSVTVTACRSAEYHHSSHGTCYPCQAFAGIVTVSVGHCHPRVAAAVAQQNRLLQHTTTIYLHHQIAQYAQELTDRMPGNLKARAFSPGT